jgi:hypothetical protein
MCGWCFESVVKEVLEKECSNRILPEDCDEDWTAWFYLREANDFALALERLCQSLKKKKVVPLEYFSAELVLLRMLEILLESGFSSPKYQHLIRRRLIRGLIAKACGNGGKESFIGLAKELNAGYLAVLYETDTYLDEGKAAALRRAADILPACLDLLRYYRRGWLRNCSYDDYMPRGLGGTTRKSDAMFEITDEQRDRFEIMLRALFFSVSMVGRCPSGRKMLHTLALEVPAYVPDFSGNDLWLQRTAALKLYDMVGFDTFRGYYADFRDTLFYYIDLKRGLSDEQKGRLLDLARQKPAGKQNDEFFSIEEWIRA